MTVDNIVVETFEVLRRSMEQWLCKMLLNHENTRKAEKCFLIFENLENFEQLESKLDSNWHWPKMVENGHFLVKNEF